MLTSLVLVCFVGTFCVYSTYCTGVEYCLFVHRSFHNLLLDKRTSPHFFYTNPVVGGKAETNQKQVVMKRLLVAVLSILLLNTAMAQVSPLEKVIFVRFSVLK